MCVWIMSLGGEITSNKQQRMELKLNTCGQRK